MKNTETEQIKEFQYCNWSMSYSPEYTICVHMILRINSSFSLKNINQLVFVGNRDAMFSVRQDLNF
jgi:hypothetical protein